MGENWKSSNFETGGTGRGGRAERRRAVDLRGTRKKEELRGDSKEGREGVEEGILQAQEANQPCVCARAVKGGRRERLMLELT